MKKSIFITVFSLFVFSITSMAQQCVSCYENTVDFNANASAVGQHNTATGQASFAMGNESISLGGSSGAFGINTEADAAASFAIGRRIKSLATSSIVLGSGYLFTDYLINGKYNTLMIGFNSTAPTFFISESPSDAGHKDRTGKVGIGNVTEPLAKLHIKADEGEDASLFLEPATWNDNSKPEIMMGDSLHGISAEVDNGMVYQTQEYHNFRGGDIYIEDIDKGVIMKSPDGKCWRGTLNNNGELHFSVMEACPDEVIAIRENKKSTGENELKVFPNPTHTFLTVELKNDKNELITVKLLDEKGMEVKMTKTTGTKTLFYTGDIAPGTYVVQIISGNKIMAKKIVKK